MALNVRDVYEEQTQRKLCTKAASYQVVFFYGAISLSGPGPPHFPGFTITQLDRVQSVGLRWTSDQTDAETCT